MQRDGRLLVKPRPACGYSKILQNSFEKRAESRIQPVFRNFSAGYSRPPEGPRTVRSALDVRVGPDASRRASRHSFSCVPGPMAQASQRVAYFFSTYA